MRSFKMFAAYFFAAAFSIWLGRVELHTDDTGILVGLIGIGGFVLAMVEPRRPWLWGLIVPAGVILVEVWNYAFGARNPHTGGPMGLCAIAAITIGVACAGAYLGAVLRPHIS